jgi:hypothetical protein
MLVLKFSAGFLRGLFRFDLGEKDGPVGLGVPGQVQSGGGGLATVVLGHPRSRFLSSSLRTFPLGEDCLVKLAATFIFGFIPKD